MINKNNKNKRLIFTKYILGILLIIAILIWVAIFQKPDDLLHVYFLDVGQGDSIYIRTKNNVDMLIDGGPGSKVLYELGEVIPFYDRKIDYILLTHPHSDHIAGLIEVIKRFDIGQVILTDATSSSKEYLEFLTTINQKNIPTKIVRSGDEIYLDEETRFKVFWPDQSYKEKNITNLNDTSIVGKLSYYDFDIIFSGDSENHAQQEIINLYKEELPAEIFKVSHHGSKNGALKEFINIINPELSIICVGDKNRFGHPHQILLDELTSSGSKVLRTDQNGRIKITSDGQSYWTKSHK